MHPEWGAVLKFERCENIFKSLSIAINKIPLKVFSEYILYLK